MYQWVLQVFFLFFEQRESIGDVSLSTFDPFPGPFSACVAKGRLHSIAGPGPVPGYVPPAAIEPRSLPRRKLKPKDGRGGADGAGSPGIAQIVI